MTYPIYSFILAMWALLLAGGGILVLVLGPISISGFGELDPVLTSGAKAAAAIILVITWIYVLSRIKNWMFRRQVGS